MSLSVSRKITAVLVPWVFLTVFATVYVMLAVPRILSGNVVALCLGAFIAFVFFVFVVAAITFSRDVLTDRWP